MLSTDNRGTDQTELMFRPILTFVANTCYKDPFLAIRILLCYGTLCQQTSLDAKEISSPNFSSKGCKFKYGLSH